MVLYWGHVVEVADAKTLQTQPMHLYTQLLWSAIPHPRRAARGAQILIPVAGTGTVSEGVAHSRRVVL
jgi:ABC-type dipeptide/oligopeptide/nickel transport system ATPase component